MKSLDLIPTEWLSDTILQKRIILHWTVTGYTPSQECLDSYHILIDGDGKLHRGSSDLDERAPHTYLFNSAIGVSICAMGGWNGSSTPYPPTKAQWDSLVETVRQLCSVYNIPVDRSHVLSHGEVTEVLGVDQWGKWDPDYWPHLDIAPGSGQFGNIFRKAVLEGTSNNSEAAEMKEVSVRVSGHDKVVKGILMDSQTMVPVRKMADAIKDLEIKSLDMSSAPKKVSLSFGEKSADLNMLMIGESGYVELKPLCGLMSWETSIETWTKDKRIVVAKPKV